MIADLGFAKNVNDLDQEKITGWFGTPLYMDPQTLWRESYTYKRDIWSLGATIFEMLTGSQPFTARNTLELKENI